MKLTNLRHLFVLACGALLMWSCGSTQPVSGLIYADVKGPVAATSNARGPAHGESCAASYVGLIALGDASITAAAKAGGVATISHVEQNSTNILGLYVKYCTIVWGYRAGGKPGAPAAKAAPAPTAEEEM